MAFSHAAKSALPDQHVSIQQTAAALNVCDKTVRRMISAGELPAIRLGHRTVRIPLAAVNAYVGRHTIPTVRRVWSDPRPAARDGIEWLDPTGNTAAHHVDTERTVGGAA